MGLGGTEEKGNGHGGFHTTCTLKPGKQRRRLFFCWRVAAVGGLGVVADAFLASEEDSSNYRLILARATKGFSVAKSSATNGFYLGYVFFMFCVR